MKYQEHGIAGIHKGRKNNHYSKQFKICLVKEHIENGVPIRELARKYNIPAHETVRTWIIKYTKGEGLKTYSPKPEVYTMKSRKVTYDEKVKIAWLMNYLIKKQLKSIVFPIIMSIRGYRKTKTWSTGLIDGRGRGKPDSIQTDEEKLRTEIEALKARNEYLETEIVALKKGCLSSLPNKIKVLNRVAYGYRNFHNFKNHILVHFKLWIGYNK